MHVFLFGKELLHLLKDAASLTEQSIMVEISGRWHLFTEFWEKPQEFALEMSRQKLAAQAKVATADGRV